MQVLLERFHKSDVVTLGTLSVIDDNNLSIFSCKSLELPWCQNKRGISCIPSGRYVCVKRYTAKYGHHFWLQNVPDRDVILLHVGNSVADSHGCILVGNYIANEQKPIKYFVRNSKDTLFLLDVFLPQKFYFTIK